jgi:hypothetical protein
MRTKVVLLLVGALAGSAATMLLTTNAPAGMAACGPMAWSKRPWGNGDCNIDGRSDLADAVYLLSYLFADGRAPGEIPGCLPATGQTRIAQPHDDGGYQAGCPVQGRFIDNGDGTVTDRCTGLMWQQQKAC